LLLRLCTLMLLSLSARPPPSPLFPYTTLFRSRNGGRRLRRAGPGSFSELGGAQLFAPGWVERPQSPHALGHRRMSDEQRREAFLGERIDRVERLRRGAGLELDELARLLEADQRIGKPVGRIAELGRASVGEELAL